MYERMAQWDYELRGKERVTELVRPINSEYIRLFVMWLVSIAVERMYPKLLNESTNY